MSSSEESSDGVCIAERYSHPNEKKKKKPRRVLGIIGRHRLFTTSLKQRPSKTKRSKQKRKKGVKESNDLQTDEAKCKRAEPGALKIKCQVKSPTLIRSHTDPGDRKKNTKPEYVIIQEKKRPELNPSAEEFLPWTRYMRTPEERKVHELSSMNPNFINPYAPWRTLYPLYSYEGYPMYFN